MTLALTTRLFALLAVALLLPTAAHAAPPATTGNTLPSKQYPIEAFVETVGLQGASFSADESRILFSSNKTGVWNAYSIPVGGGE